MTDKLVIHYENVGSFPDNRQQLIDQLTESGFLGQQFAQHAVDGFVAGPAFLQFISFIGCSPTLYTNIDDRNKAGFCYIEVSPISNTIQLIGGNNIRTFLCPKCSYRQKNAADIIPGLTTTGSSDIWSCSNCAKQIATHDLDLQQQGGFGRFYIAIHGIGEGLALPADQLMQKLVQITGETWRFFYYHGD